MRSVICRGLVGRFLFWAGYLALYCLLLRWAQLYVSAQSMWALNDLVFGGKNGLELHMLRNILC